MAGTVLTSTAACAVEDGGGIEQTPECPTQRPNLQRMLFLDPHTREFHARWAQEAQRAGRFPLRRWPGPARALDRGAEPLESGHGCRLLDARRESAPLLGTGPVTEQRGRDDEVLRAGQVVVDGGELPGQCDAPAHGLGLSDGFMGDRLLRARPRPTAGPRASAARRSTRISPPATTSSCPERATAQVVAALNTADLESGPAEALVRLAGAPASPAQDRGRDPHSAIPGGSRRRSRAGNGKVTSPPEKRCAPSA